MSSHTRKATVPLCVSVFFVVAVSALLLFGAGTSIALTGDIDWNAQGAQIETSDGSIDAVFFGDRDDVQTDRIELQFEGFNAPNREVDIGIDVRGTDDGDEDGWNGGAVSGATGWETLAEDSITVSDLSGSVELDWEEVFGETMPVEVTEHTEIQPGDFQEDETDETREREVEFRITAVAPEEDVSDEKTSTATVAVSNVGDEAEGVLQIVDGTPEATDNREYSLEDDAVVEFELENTGDEPATIEEIRLDSTTNEDAMRISVLATNDCGSFFFPDFCPDVEDEVVFDAPDDGNDGFIDTDGSSEESIFFADEDEFDGPTEFDVEPVVEPGDGGTVEVLLGDFREEPFVTDSEVDMSGESVTFTLFYEVDGEEFEQTLTADTGASSNPESLSAGLEVEITDAAQQVEADETLEVDYAVENTGDEADEQNIFLVVDNDDIMPKTVDVDMDVSLDPGGTETGTLEWDTGGDNGLGELGVEAGDEVEVEVQSDDNTDSRTVEVVEETESVFEVDITDAPESAEVDDEITVEAEVENVGGAGGLRDVTFLVNGTEVDNEQVSLMSGNAETVEFNYTAVEDDVPEIDVTVATDDDSDSRTVTVEPEEEDETQFDSAEVTDAQPDELRVTFDEGVAADDGSGFSLDAPDDLGTESLVTVDGDTVVLSLNRSVEFGEELFVSYDEPEGTVVSDDDGTPAVGFDEEPVDNNVEEDEEEEPSFDVEIDDDQTDDAVTEGEIFTVVADVNNTGGAGEQDVEFVVEDDDGTELFTDTETVDLGEGGSEEVTFVYETEIGDAPEIDVTVATDDDSDSRTFTVDEAEAGLEVQAFDDEFDDAEEGADFSEVTVTVDETEGVDADGAETTLTVVGDTEGEIFNQTVGGDLPADGTEEFTFDVGVIENADSYTATATTDADNAETDTRQTTFEVAEIAGKFNDLEAEPTNPGQLNNNDVRFDVDPAEAETVELRAYEQDNTEGEPDDEETVDVEEGLQEVTNFGPTGNPDIATIEVVSLDDSGNQLRRCVGTLTEEDNLNPESSITKADGDFICE